MSSSEFRSESAGSHKTDDKAHTLNRQKTGNMPASEQEAQGSDLLQETGNMQQARVLNSKFETTRARVLVLAHAAAGHFPGTVAALFRATNDAGIARPHHVCRCSCSPWPSAHSEGFDRVWSSTCIHECICATTA